MTLGEIKKASMALIDEYSEHGANYTTDNEISNKLCAIIDAVQCELATIKKIRKSIKIVNYLPENLSNARGIIPHYDQDVTLSACKGKSYYFQVDGAAVIVIKVGGITVDTINHTPSQSSEKGYEAIYGFLPNASNKPVDIVFGGDYYYTIKNFAIYAANFPSAQSIPPYSDYLEYTLPAAFYQLEAVKLRNGETVNSLPSEIEIKDKNTLLLHSEATGEYEIKYYAYPQKITDSTSHDTELEIDEDVQRLIPYAVAADVLKTDYSTDYSAFEKKYRDKLSLLDTRNNLSKAVSFKSFISGGGLLK